MGRTGSGVEVRDTSIRLTFLPGKPTLALDGVPWPPTPANIKRAHRLAAEIREKIKHDTFSMAEYFPASGSSGGTLTVANQLDTWLAAQRIEASTRAGYESAARFWKATLGDRPLRALKHSDVLTALATRPQLTGKTVNNYVSVLREALELAVADRILTDNPAGKVPRAKHQKEAPDPFTADEVEAILADMQAHYDEQVWTYTRFKFYTGLRTSESFGLRWSSIDFKSGRFVVSEGVVRGIEKATTKTNVARTVLLNNRATNALMCQKKFTFLVGQHVFHDPRAGTRWSDERAFRRSYWTPTLKRLGIRYRPPYNTRHTYATMMLMAGMRPAFCAKQLGHSVEMFLRTYAKWMDGAQDALEMGKLEAALSGAASSAGSPTAAR